MKAPLFLLFLVLALVSCAIQQEVVQEIPTYSFMLPSTSVPTSTITQTITVVSSTEIPNRFSVVDNRKIKFDNWHVSVILPEDWDIDKHQLGYDGGFHIELYLFWGPEFIIEKGWRFVPEVIFSFHPFKNELEESTYLTDKLPDAIELGYKIEKSFSPEEIGLGLASATVQKCRFESVKQTCFVIRAVHKNNGIEIHMSVDARIFPQVETQFLEIIRSISFED